jgi:hypothetical protein
MHKPSRCRLLAVAAMLAVASPAAASFTVSVSGKTTLVTQHDADTLILTRAGTGELVASSGPSLEVYPATDNLIVRGTTDATTPSSLFIVLDSPLPGSLALDLPGRSNVTVRGAAASIGGALRVKGGNGDQIVRLGADGEPTTVAKAVNVDLGGGNDTLAFPVPSTVKGALTVRGVNTFDAGVLRVDRTFSFDSSRENLEVRLDVDVLDVGKSFKVKSGPGRESVRIVHGGTVGRHVTLDLGTGSGSAHLGFDRIGGNVKASFGSGADDSHFLGFPGSGLVVKGSVAMTMLGRFNNLQFYGRCDGSSIRYTGGAGMDFVNLYLVAPRAKATFLLGAGDDDLNIGGGPEVVLGRLTVDFGDGNDDFFDHGWVPPPGSTITGLP